MKSQFDSSRRAFVKGSVAIGLSGSAFFDALSASLRDEKVVSIFTHGVASGEPQQTSMLLWTRVDPNNNNVPARVKWELSLDIYFNNVIQQGQIDTNHEKDHTVKVMVNNLNPDTTYYYRFFSSNQYSEVGRTKTLPIGSLSSVCLAITSCSNYAFGFFNAYEDIAKDDSIDYVLHLGDYIYEYGQQGWGGAIAKQINRQHLPEHETVSLSDYRTRHAQYKRDRASRMMHASHPLIPIWDDHESTNNPYMEGAQNHQPETEGKWSERRADSLQAYFEWMPVYDPIKGENPSAMWRQFAFGDLAKMVTLETRHTGRSKQIDYNEYLDKINNSEDLQNFKNVILNDPTRKMLSPEMESFYKNAFDREVGNHRPWHIVANQIPIAKTHVPTVEDFISVKTKGPNDPLLQERKGLSLLSRFDLPLYTDTWDGYPMAREQFYNMNQSLGIQDLLVLTGDSHSFWLNQLFNLKDEPMGVEIGTAGVSSPGDFLTFGDEIAKEMDKRLIEHNNEVLWTNGRENGYVKLIISKDKAQIDYIKVSTVLSEDYHSSLLKRVNIIRKNDRITVA